MGALEAPVPLRVSRHQRRGERLLAVRTDDLALRLRGNLGHKAKVPANGALGQKEAVLLERRTLGDGRVRPARAEMDQPDEALVVR
jgi:hypothetical protein